MEIEIIDHGAEAKGHYPTRAYANDAGADVYMPYNWNFFPGVTEKVPLGFGLRIPHGYVGFVFPRSSLSARGLTCELPPIDPDYTDQIHAVVTNNSRDAVYVNAGDRIGQLVVLPCATITNFDVMNEGRRGAKGFGSTGR